MTISLQVDENQHRALHRVLVRPGWSTGSWTELPMLGRQDLGTMANGYWLESYRRRTMPEIGDAWIRYQFGRISGAQYDATNLGETTRGAADLSNYEIRIQAAPGPTNAEKQTGSGSDASGAFQPKWRTVWWGTCDYYLDTIQPGHATNAGERRYYCLDGLARKKRRQLDKHGAYVVGNTTFQHAPLEGHPGYNLSRGEAPLMGNRQSYGSGFLRYSAEPTVPNGGGSMPLIDYHTFAGNGDYWTDLQVLTNVDLISRSLGDPVFTVVEDIAPGARSLLQSASAWTVQTGQPAWDLMAKITRRQRGRGLAYCDWDDDSSAPGGDLVPKLHVRPQTYADSTFELKDGTTVTLSGAKNAGTAVDIVDLEGDHRNVAESFQLGARNLNRVDWLESFGERIQVMVTIGVLDGTLGKRWTDAEATAFNALDPLKRLDSRWTPVYRVYWLEPSWDGHVKNGNGGSSSRADYTCADNGAIVLPDDDTFVQTSPLLTAVLKNLPLFEGYSYQTVPAARYDGQAENGEPERRKPLLLIRAASDRWLDGKDEVGLSMAMGENEMEIAYPGDQGTRLVGDKTASGLGSAYNTADLAMTVCLELPHRVRYASGDLFPGARRLRIEHQNIHLWLAHPDAIWELDTASRDSNGSPPRRGAGGGTSSGGANVPGIIRDDRDQLAQLHALAWTWYGQDRRSARWTLRCCGFLPSFTTDDGTVVPYPSLGQVVHHLQANGETFLIDTPISGMDYDNASETTTWITDWQNLDFTRGG